MVKRSVDNGTDHCIAYMKLKVGNELQRKNRKRINKQNGCYKPTKKVRKS